MMHTMQLRLVAAGLLSIAPIASIATIASAAATTEASPGAADGWRSQYGGGGRSDPRSRPGEGTRGRDRDGAGTAEGSVDIAWLDRIPRDDRAALDAAIGFAPPPFPETLRWFGLEAPPTWETFRGKVVLIQSWTTRSAGGRSQPQRLAESLKEFTDKDLVRIALHTPEGAERIDDFLGQRPESTIWAVDPVGDFADGLGIYRRPVNILVDRDGTVRYAALNPNGLEKAVAELVARPFDENNPPRQRSTTKAPDAPAAGWPTFTDPVRSAMDLRGRPSPPFQVQTWISGQQEPNGRMVLVDFFATWCGPCMAAVPHMNDLAARYGGDVLIVGLSDESKSDFESGLAKRNRKPNDFRYALALDRNGTMKKGYGVRGIPHCALISPDGIVRWQGHPSQLTTTVMDQLVAAHRAAAGGSGSGGSGGSGSSDAGAPPKRWANDRRR